MSRRPKQIETDKGPVPRFTSTEYLLMTELMSFGRDGTYMADWANRSELDGSAFFKAVSRLSSMGVIETTGTTDLSPKSRKRIYRRVSGIGEFTLEINDSVRASETVRRSGVIEHARGTL